MWTGSAERERERERESERERERERGRGSQRERARERERRERESGLGFGVKGGSTRHLCGGSTGTRQPQDQGHVPVGFWWPRSLLGFRAFRVQGFWGLGFWGLGFRV